MFSLKVLSGRCAIPPIAAPPSRPVQVGLRQSSLESAPASRAREGNSVG